MFTPNDRRKCEQLYDKYYAGRKFFDSRYRELIRKYLRPGQRLLDAGCGRYLRFCKELSDTAHVVGIDLDTVIETNNQSEPFGLRGDLGHLPFPSNHFDMVISRSVVEHLEDPKLVFEEFCRVLRPGGKVVIVTPNKYDYVSLIAALTPYKVHRALVSKIFSVPEDDVFPTLYRANTISALGKTLAAAGFVEKEMTTVNHYPAYLMFSPVLFRLGVAYERLTSLEMFRSLRGSLL
ncbi:MAG TPA: class I SAM-dependent methyltransferase, partial [Bryobacteraceae bacterium]|nr:class I SAM-dependent methyltransferase [Bryobacteraceae bacterium]